MALVGPDADEIGHNESENPIGIETGRKITQTEGSGKVTTNQKTR